MMYVTVWVRKRNGKAMRTTGAVLPMMKSVVMAWYDA
jgi:hypothetical protein